MTHFNASRRQKSSNWLTAFMLVILILLVATRSPASVAEVANLRANFDSTTKTLNDIIRQIDAIQSMPERTKQKNWRSEVPIVAQQLAYFTTDDSSSQAALANLFVGEARQNAPFTVRGRVAYKAHVFTCDGGKTKFIGYLERYSDRALKEIQAIQSNPEAAQARRRILEHFLETGVEVKRPGEAFWLNNRSVEKFKEIQTVKAPEGAKGKLEYVVPK